MTAIMRRDKRGELVVEPLDGARRFAQHRVAERADLAPRRSLALGRHLGPLAASAWADDPLCVSVWLMTVLYPAS